MSFKIQFAKLLKIKVWKLQSHEKSKFPQVEFSISLMRELNLRVKPLQSNPLCQIPEANPVSQTLGVELEESSL